ncbi:MAG: OmpA family protein [Ferruginibacter sp.]
MPSLTYYTIVVKKILLSAFILLLAVPVKAQNKYGIMGGVGRTSLNKIRYANEDFSRYSSITSYWGGLTANISLGNSGLHLFATATYIKRGYNYLLQNPTRPNNSVKDSGFSQSLNYIDINPNLLMKFTLGQKTSFFAGTGPSLNIFASGSEKISLTYFGNTPPPSTATSKKLTVGNTPGAYKRTFISLNFLLGVEYGRFSLWANYNLPLDYYYQDANKNLQHKLTTFGVNAGFALFTNDHTEKVKKEKKAKREKTVTAPVPAIVIDSLADADNDGIPDIKDKCPGHKGTARYNGCPVPDTDGDGINDDEDKCPLVAGLSANNGCPAITEPEKISAKDTTRFTIYFEPGKSLLRTDGFNALSEVVNLLKANSKLVVVFEGHTDNVGSVEANNSRAVDRAAVCVDYVASFYINRNRLMITSYGNSRPVADLNDPLVQWKNRRVEVLVFEKKE